MTERLGITKYYGLMPDKIGSNTNGLVQHVLSSMKPGDKVCVANILVEVNGKVQEVQGPDFVIQ